MGETVSVVIPTHNRGAVLTKALASLDAAALPRGLDLLEVVVVANACTDATEDLVAHLARGMHLPVRCVEEPYANLSVARNRGVAESRGAIILMLDDDVVVEREWLAGMLEVYREYPASLVAGRVSPWWEDGSVRPAWFLSKFEGFLSVRDHGEEVKELYKPGDALGANYSFRRSVFDAIGGFRPGLGRTGSRLIGGEEVDFTRRAFDRGARLFYAPRGGVGHVIGRERVTHEYLCAIARGNACSRVYMDPRWTRLGALARSLSGCSLLLGSLPGALLFSVLGSESRRVECLMRRHRGLGMLQGHLQRLLGRTPLDQYAAAGRGTSAGPVRIAWPTVERKGASTVRVSACIDGVSAWFESDAADLIPAPEAFVAAFLLPALHAGRGLSCEAPVCAAFAKNMGLLAQRFRAWWRYDDVRVRLVTGNAASRPGSGVGVVQCFSGGVDSFHALLRDDGLRPDSLLFVGGYDIPLSDGARARTFDRSLDAVATGTGARVLRIRSNLREHPTFAAAPWGRSHGGALSAAGHLLGAQRLVIPSSYQHAQTFPWGSHPETDPLYGSSAVEIRHDGGEWTRAEKLAAIVANPLVCAHLRVCWENRNETLNCGRCEKCVRTLLVVRALGAAGEFSAFAVIDDDELLRRVRHLPQLADGAAVFWREIDATALPAPLARAVRLKLLAHRLKFLAPYLALKSAEKLVRRTFRGRRPASRAG